MKPPTKFKFEVAHFQINVWLLPLVDLVFDDICNPFVIIDFESMFQRSLYDYIYKLQFTGIFAKINTSRMLRCFFLSSQKIVFFNI
jgi:hypothetical protein